MDSRRLHLRAARDRPRFRRGADLDAVLTISGRRCLGQRLLGPDPVHAADVADHHHRPRAGDIRADGKGDSRDRRLGATPRGAVALVTFFALATSWFNWGFSLVFSAVLAREVARRVAGVDYRALAAASLLGIGSIWAQGLSGSAALQMATPGALQPQIRDIVAAGGIVPGGMIPFRHTIFLWQSVVSVLVEIVVVVFVMWLATPPAAKAKTAAMLGIDLGKSEIQAPPTPEGPIPPGAWLEHSPLLNLAGRRDRRDLHRALLQSRAGTAQRDHDQHPQL